MNGRRVYSFESFVHSIDQAKDTVRFEFYGGGNTLVVSKSSVKQYEKNIRALYQLKKMRTLGKG